MGLQTRVDGFVCTGPRVEFITRNGEPDYCNMGRIVSYSVTQEEGLKVSDNVNAKTWGRLIKELGITTGL